MNSDNNIVNLKHENQHLYLSIIPDITTRERVVRKYGLYGQFNASKN